MQISGSSSTIRMSYAIRHLHRQNERGHRPRTVGPVVERQPTAMVLHDLLDDGEPKPGALRFVCYIGFRQARTVLLRQPGTIIGHDDANIVGVGLYGQTDRSTLPVSL